MRFSQRLGLTPVKVDVQIDSMDDDLKVALWNAFSGAYVEKYKETSFPDSKLRELFILIWRDFLKKPLDEFDYYTSVNVHRLKRIYMDYLWYEVYDFIEFVSNTQLPYVIDSEIFMELCNSSLEKELSAYRLVGGQIVQITDEQEIVEIEGAINNEEIISGVKIHLSRALQLLSDRKTPDYRNSIKESISAVESIAQVITGDSKASLGNALKTIDEKVGIHKALRNGLSSIYGYTSDEGGIRHAMLEEKDIHFEDAKYMLVSCSAFINYLFMKSNRAGIPLK